MKFIRYSVMPDGSISPKSDGIYIGYGSLKPAIDEVFEQYEEDLAFAAKTGLLEDKEIYAVKATLKNLKDRLKVETATI